MRNVIAAASVTFLMLVGMAEGQWLNYPDPRVPHAADGKPILTAPTPRTADGKPDLTGTFHVQAEPMALKRQIFGPDFGKMYTVGMEPTTTSIYATDVLLDYKPGDIVMTAEAEDTYQRRRQGQELSPVSRCLPAGIPRGTLLSEAFKIIQAPGITAIIHELDGFPRQIYTDGRPLPTKIEFPSWLGYSVGRWDGDTFIVDTKGFNDKSWLDSRGHPHSEDMHITEKVSAA